MSCGTVSRRGFLRGAAFGLTAAATAPLAGRVAGTAAAAFQAPSISKHNIIVIMTDDQAASSMPVMRKLMARPHGSWVTFNNAVCNDPICAPSRATFFSGQHSHKHGVIKNGWDNRLDETRTVPVWLKGAGYRTALYGKYQNGWAKKKKRPTPPGWDIFVPSGGLADGLVEPATDFIRHTAEPFFLCVTPVDPHFWAKPPARYKGVDVYVPPQPPNLWEADVSDKPSYVQKAQNKKGKINRYRKELVQAQRALLAVDDLVQEIIDTLEQSGKLENTVIVFLSDHGFLFGEHNLIKKHWPYEEAIRIPLMIRFPGVAGNRDESRVVSNVDLASTFCEIAGVVPTAPQNGRSLVPLIKNPGIYWDEAALLEKHIDGRGDFEFFGVRTAGWTYVEYSNGEKELYDLTADPYQLENQANKPAYSAKQAELKARMEALLAGEHPPVATATPTATATEIPTETSTPTSTATTEPSPTATNTVEPTATTEATATAEPSPTATNTVEPTATMEATATPTCTPTPP